ncbi:hypothetical protein ABGN05_06915 [Aquibium sp. LZ166]|uniref:Porin n=1 Tax=Aquibium pacificus TaxID=3153579 RepID=A0ABV3SFQ7_9HYPH
MRILRTTSLSAACAAACTILPGSVLAADPAKVPIVVETYRYMEGTLDLEFGNDWVFRADDPGAEVDDLYFLGELGVRLGLTPIFAINLGLTAESVLDPEPFEGRAFGDIGLYVDTLNLEAQLGAAKLFAGKFGPAFGTAWDITPGVYGTEFAEDYELSEQIGFGAAYEFDAGTAGKHTLGGHVFFVDTTFLSDSIFTRRGRVGIDDGGIANTETLNNFSITLDGTEIEALPGFSYNLGYRHLSAGATETADEDGFVAGLAKETAFANGMVLGLNGEIAYFSDAAGVAGDDAVYTTVGLSIANGPWHGELAGTVRRFDLAGAGSTSDHIAQVSAGYGFENGIDVSAGYAHVREADLDYDIIGLRLTKSFEFTSRK